ncbi:unnamed protein product [Arabidopsis lyrata]|nr:unnamed protein product [Arabidopsis lyrata]
MGGLAMEEMPLSALFDQARKLHLAPSESGVDQAMELVPDEELEASSRGGSGSPADRRALKIARFKRQKAAEAKLLEIKERKERRGRSTKASALSTPVESGEEDIPDDDSE